MRTVNGDDLFFEIKREFRQQTQSGRYWKKCFLNAFNSCTPQRLASFLEVSTKDRRVKRAIKSGGTAGLRPDQQREFIGIQR